MNIMFLSRALPQEIVSLHNCKHVLLLGNFLVSVFHFLPGSLFNNKNVSNSVEQGQSSGRSGGRSYEGVLRDERASIRNHRALRGGNSRGTPDMFSNDSLFRSRS